MAFKMQCLWCPRLTVGASFKPGNVRASMQTHILNEHGGEWNVEFLTMTDALRACEMKAEEDECQP